ncbi:MAG: hypothetical protein AB1733_15390 [Thermodesulfobacteriota bacterium]
MECFDSCNHRVEVNPGVSRVPWINGGASMLRFRALITLATFVLATMSFAILPLEALSQQPLPAQRWKITSVKICRGAGGQVLQSIQAIGAYPVYTFFIPRPVWTVNGSVVDTKPVYHSGKLIAFELYDAASKLNPGTKNTIKFALPDHAGSIVFLYDHSQIPPGECYEFF